MHIGTRRPWQAKQKCQNIHDKGHIRGLNRDLWMYIGTVKTLPDRQNGNVKMYMIKGAKKVLSVNEKLIDKPKLTLKNLKHN